MSALGEALHGGRLFGFRLLASIYRRWGIVRDSSHSERWVVGDACGPLLLVVTSFESQEPVVLHAGKAASLSAAMIPADRRHGPLTIDRLESPDDWSEWTARFASGEFLGRSGHIAT